VKGLSEVKETRLERWLGALPGLVPALPVVTAAWALKALFGKLVSDATFLDLAQARHWLEMGKPWVSQWNPVCTAGSPLHLGMLALGGQWMGVAKLEAWSLTLATLGDGLALVLGFLYLRALGVARPLALFGIAAMGGGIGFAAASAMGSEASWFTAILFFALWASVQKQTHLGLAVALFLLPCMRLDGSVLGLLLLAQAWITRPRHSKILLSLAWTGGVLTYFGFYAWAYGHGLPQSLLAQWATWPSSGPWVAAWELGKPTLFALLTRGPSLGSDAVTATAVSLLALLSAIGFIRGRRWTRAWGQRPTTGERSFWSAFPLQLVSAPMVPPLIFLALSPLWLALAGGTSPLYPSLFAPYVAVGWCVMGVGLQAWKPVVTASEGSSNVDSAIPNPEEMEERPWPVWIGFAPMGLAALSLWFALQQEFPHRYKRAHDQREGRLAKASIWVNEVRHRYETGSIPDSLLRSPFPGYVTVLTDAVGILTYRTEARIIEPDGKVTAEALGRLRRGEGRDAVWEALKRDLKPEIAGGMRPLQGLEEEVQRYAGYRSGYLAGAPGSPHLLYLGLRDSLQIQDQPR
jgi:hypothetical protein